MKKRNINEIFILLSLVLVTTICIILSVVIGRLNKKDEIDETIEPDTSLCDEINDNSEGIGVVEFFNINSCMNQYLNTLNKTDTSASSNTKQKLFDMLCEKYINENNITIQNIYNFVRRYENKENEVFTYIPLEASILQDKSISSFLIRGIISDSEYNAIDEIFAVINLDMINNIFSIEPIYGEYTNISQINIKEVCNSINQGQYNHFSQAVISDEDIARNYINIYKRLAIGNPDAIYNFLDKTYRETKFGSLDEFKEYISNNKDEIEDILIDKYNITYSTNYTQYICIDENENYYIIKEKGPLDYTLILDTYTVDVPEFLEKYNSTTEQGKVLLNLNKFALALNDGDYKYAYSKLADGFKANNFPTLSSFETYVKSNLFTKNKFNYKKFGKEGETYYTYTVDITNDSGALSNTINKTFIMQLGEGTDFKLSFNK